ncbi:glycogen debranching enzyme [Synechococcus sp. PCC 7502]|uniref:MGH1-like glycoside hydrolase domain-containing protein n=1 Tax=Synechococcus sp. PCC 7502 TaxID=1173263 RepID=UPI00029FD4A2|nr:glycogen debranching protein [Synechococcus sp. PCC 7502]AFY75088.1 glycogen debranching enzyme [Synechococcus sp. PCC 7502]
MINPEQIRLTQARNGIPWRKWGCYLSERQWGTVREDYSDNGTAWEYFSHDQARSRAYRWGEDGIAGISDDRQILCFAIALWNGVDPIIKERLFGLTGNEGNHGEDVKEYYFYLDNTPTHSYMKYLYKYPQAPFPYDQLVAENKQRGRNQPEYELLDTDVFAGDRYFDVSIEYAKHSPQDISIQISITNHAPDTASIHLLPTLWFRNTWVWHNSDDKPFLALTNETTIVAESPNLDKMWLHCPNCEEILFTDNETNYQKLFGAANGSKYVKDGINNYIVHGQKDAVNPEQKGTKASAHYELAIASGATKIVNLRLSNIAAEAASINDEIFAKRLEEANQFYHEISPFTMTDDLRSIQRQAFAGMLWSKQYYNFSVKKWLDGDPDFPMVSPNRKNGRNSHWFHLETEDILSMPDKWEYPWFAAWDSAFHAIPFAMIDPDFAKSQLDLITREWYMHPNGQIPAYEWAFGDVNPPVHAWATYRVYKIEQKQNGTGDRQFLERVFHKLLLNFTWWVNRKDREGKNVFEGGFLGLDNIGVFDRSAELPTGGYMEQADGTSWMGMYCLNLLAIALELAQENIVYEDIATKFFEHFLYIADAMNKVGIENTELWDDDDGFYYDVLHLPNGKQLKLKVRSLVGLIPLFAVQILEPDMIAQVPNFQKRLEWFVKHRFDLAHNVACMESEGMKARRLLAICDRFKLKRILTKMLDEAEFLSDYGIRALSKYHRSHPYIWRTNGSEYRVDYEPAESSSGLFGGNSNWRGPIWMPVNFLIIESLQKFHHYYGNDFTIEYPSGSGQMMTLWDVSVELSRRLINIFSKDTNGDRPVNNGNQKFQTDPHWQDLIQFYEYFHGDHGTGVGASHQTGWTGLVAKLIQQLTEHT